MSGGDSPKGSSKKKKKPEADSPFGVLAAMRDRMAEEEKRAKAAGAGSTPQRAPRPEPRPTRAAGTVSGAAASGDDLDFHRLMSGVTPLDDRRTRVPKTAPREPRRAPRDVRAEVAREAEEVHEHLRALVEGGTRFEVSDDGRRVEGRRTDVPPEWLRKLRRGQLPIDARIDLHGMSAEAAEQALATFLGEKRALRERCVLVIHGKGEHSPGGRGVLRGEVAAWLAQGRGSTHVAAFCTALESEGGEGAVYVLLRR